MYLDKWVSINLTVKVYYGKKRDETKSHLLEWIHIYQDLWKKKKKKSTYQKG